MKRIFFTTACLFIFCTTSWASDTVYNVLDYGAIGDGRADNTMAFQAALDAAGKTGMTVYVPPRQYRFDGVLTIPDGVTLRGTWEGPHLPDIQKGSALFIYAGRDHEDSPPFLTLNPNSVVKGLTLYYPEQKIGDIHPYPWTIQRRGFRCSMIDLAIANTYNGIDCGTYPAGGQHLRNIDMSALRRGVYIDRSYDIGRIENVHIHPVSWVYGDDKGRDRELWEYLLKNLEGFIIGKCDWEYMTNCFVIFTRVGFRFIEMELKPGQERGIAEQGNILITQSGADLCFQGVRVEKVQEHAGIAFENCQFMSGIEIENGNTGPVKLTNCGFWGVSRTGSVIVNNGQGTVILNACHFSAWDDERFRPGFVWNPSIPFIKMTDGSLLMSSCLFKDFGNTPEAHIYLGEKVRSASIIGNSVEHGKLGIKNMSRGDVQTFGNVSER
ncbi:glycoside hydrolase family 55 protein [bacterium]|nr:glycoside hydrolase family 55 protein [bacterium]